MSGLTSREKTYHLIREIIWLLITAIIINMVMLPITSKIDYIYWRINTFFIFVAVTYFRYSVTFKSLPFLRPAWIRFLLFTINLSLFVYLAQNEQKLISMADNFYLEDFGFPKVFIDELQKRELFRYLYTQMVFFGTASLITLSAFQIRLIISYWQYYKHQANRLLED
jgi:hypothetical protein